MILVTNDDGVYSPGLIALAKALARVSDIRVVAPKGAQSSTGMSVTFHRPVRISEIKLRNYEATAIGGTPADCVFVSVHKLFKKNKIDMIASGINIGENISMQSFFSSGTVSAAMSGSVIGIRAVAFSKEIGSEDEFLTEKDFELSAWWAGRIVAFLLKRGFPTGVDLLNVNFPLKTTKTTPIRITRMAGEMFDEYVVERRDPRGDRYFWLAGTKKVRADPGTDLHTVLGRSEISITPISIGSIQSDASSRPGEFFHDLIG